MIRKRDLKHFAHMMIMLAICFGAAWTALWLGFFFAELIGAIRT